MLMLKVCAGLSLTLLCLALFWQSHALAQWKPVIQGAGSIPALDNDEIVSARGRTALSSSDAKSRCSSFGAVGELRAVEDPMPFPVLTSRKVCVNSTSVFHDGPAVGFDISLSAAPGTRVFHVNTLPPGALTADEPSDSVLFVMLISASLYHSVHDHVIPSLHFLDTVLRNVTERHVLALKHPFDRSTAFNVIPVMGSLIGPLIEANNTLKCYKCAIIVGEHLLNRLPLGSNRFREAAVRRFRHELMRMFRTGVVDGTDAVPPGAREHLPPSTSSVDGAAPSFRLLLVGRRHTRRIGNLDHLGEAARSVGFDVKIAFFDDLSLKEQFELVVATDVFVTIHGAALTWLLALDTGTSPWCRTVIELRHWGRRFKGRHNVYAGLALDAHVHHLELKGASVRFGPTVSRSVQSASRRLHQKQFPHELPEFHDQTVFYDAGVFAMLLRTVHEHLRKCLK